ncbi:MAG: nucleotidyltransferase [Clostridia bacterium]|nr:nucleotidyltransferase [Clostridia bacterium]
MKKTLVILAAGIGSRFGGGIKQLEPVGPNGEIIMDYSIHDAISAGFNKIVFIIRRDIEADFKEIIGNRIEKIAGQFGVEVCYAFQNMDNIPEKLREGRTKPWGTAHALLCCDGLIDGPFTVINADDYYGIGGFKKASDFLETNRYGIVTYILGNTLSDNGGVSRGICKVEDGKLIDIAETRNLVKVEGGAESEGVFYGFDTPVSMNFWCLPSSFIDVLRERFPDFLANLENPLKDEYLLPSMVDYKIKSGEECTALSTDAKWFGVTYKEDKQSVVESFRKLYEEGVYSTDFYSDIK